MYIFKKIQQLHLQKITKNNKRNLFFLFIRENIIIVCILTKFKLFSFKQQNQPIKSQYSIYKLSNNTSLEQQFYHLLTNIIKMQSYLKYIFQNFVIKSSFISKNKLTKDLTALDQIKQQLLQLKPVDLTAYYKEISTFSTLQKQNKKSQISSLIFDQLNLLLAKGIIKYSPSNCTIQLSLPNLMVYQRLFKLQKFAQKYLDKNVAIFISTWIQQALQQGLGFPVSYEKKNLSKIFIPNQIEQIIDNQIQSKKKSKSKGKLSIQSVLAKQKTEKQQLYNYHKLVYEYKSQQKQKIQTQTKQESKNTNSIPKKGNKQVNNQKNTSKQSHQQVIDMNQEYMLNVEELTVLLQISKHLEIMNSKVKDLNKQKKLSLFELVNLKQRQSLMNEIRYQKIEQYLAQILDQDCLLVFNLIKKYPFITEKQLITLTLMDVAETRAGLNKLIEKGFVYFYHENARTIVYKIADQSILERNYLDIISRSILNLSLAGQRLTDNTLHLSTQIVKNKLIQFENQIQRLDDILLIFGY